MAKWKLVSKHEYGFVAAFPIYLKILGGFFVGLLMTVGGLLILIIGNSGGLHVTPVTFGGVFVMFGVVLCGAMVVAWPWKRVRWVRVYEEGIKWAAGRREHRYGWDEVTNVIRSELQVVSPEGRRSDLSRTAYLDLSFDDGTGVRFDPALSNYCKLAEYAQKASASRQLNESTADLDETGKDFGPVHVSRKGVTVHGKAFTWKELKWLSVYNGELYAHPTCTKWRPITLNSIPNYVLMLSLVKGLGRLRE
jgi:hypothetical protein